MRLWDETDVSTRLTNPRDGCSAEPEEHRSILALRMTFKHGQAHTLNPPARLAVGLELESALMSAMSIASHLRPLDGLIVGHRIWFPRSRTACARLGFVEEDRKKLIQVSTDLYTASESPDHQVRYSLTMP